MMCVNWTHTHMLIFSGMYVHDKPTDPVYVKIHAGFIVTFLDFPVLWVSKLQTKTARSTMEA